MFYLIFNYTNEERTILILNCIHRTIDGIEKSSTEYKFHLDDDILAVVNVIKSYRFVHNRHYRDKTYPLDDVCYYSSHFEDLVKLLGGKREGNPSPYKYFGETIIFFTLNGKTREPPSH